MHLLSLKLCDVVEVVEEEEEEEVEEVEEVEEDDMAEAHKGAQHTTTHIPTASAAQ
jgi:hypothetical protein